MLSNKLSTTFQAFVDSEKASGLMLIAATLAALAVANNGFLHEYQAFWHQQIVGLSLEHWVNDALMAVFFLLIGLELERELYNGELSNFSNALLPIMAAIGGMLMPALLHLIFNQHTSFQAGFGIPMATDIAFALGVLSMLGACIPPSLKVFLVAFAVIDDLGAAIMIALFYTSTIVVTYLFAAIGVLLVLIVLNRMRVMVLWPYLTGGVLMWWFTWASGVHATLAGVAIAFAIPFTAKKDDEYSPSHKLEHMLHRPVAFVIMPIFALANTAVMLDANTLNQLFTHTNSLGILVGLVIGKPVGVVLFVFLATQLLGCKLPNQVRWSHVIGAGMLGGIGFTMSIFITNLAFVGMNEAINLAKTAILLGSLCSGVFGLLWLYLLCKTENLL